MSTFCNQIEEIKALIYQNKSLAYSTFSLLQEQSANDPSLLQTLADNSQNLVSLIISDIAIDDEEVAAQALKCLGFIIYHPSLVSTIPVDDAYLVLEALVKVIMSTKIKSVCNLGVWCISMQQFEASILAGCFNSVLQAVVHALDNPTGSLSTTYEAMQAVMKLAAQLSERMRESSHIWAPPICRRLLSTDKRERDMSERCLLKIRPTIIPPPPSLSKALAEDMKLTLLTVMKDLLNQGLKIQTLQAWGWFIRLQGSHAMKYRHLTNDMLKIPEKTFSDHNPQVQIASLVFHLELVELESDFAVVLLVTFYNVAWEGLVDAFIDPALLTSETNEPFQNGIQQVRTSGGISCQFEASGCSKSIKLIMTPLIGIISSKCDVSVYSSCLNTWCYLLHKLDISINHPSVIKLVLDPIFGAVFQFGPDVKTFWLWNLCLDLLDDFILAKCRNLDHETSNQVSHHSTSSKFSWKQQHIKWLPWTIGQLDFLVKMMDIIISHASIATITPENRSSACNAALRIFRSFLKGVQMDFRSSSTKYNDIMLCLNTLLRFVKKICEDVTSEGGRSSELHHASLQFLEAAAQDLEPSILRSPLYKVSLNLTYIENLQMVDNIKNVKYLGISSVAYMDMVSPSVYLSVLYICVVIPSPPATNGMELLLQGLHRFFKTILLLYDPVENVSVAVDLLYKHMEFRHLDIWTAIAKGLEDFFNGLTVKDHSLLKLDSNRDFPLAVCHLLSYPFVVCSCPRPTQNKDSGSLKESLLSSERKLKLQQVAEVWKSLYVALCASKFNKFSETSSLTEDLCSMLNGCIDQNISMLDHGTEKCFHRDDLGLAYLSGNAVTCVMEQQILTLEASSVGNNVEYARDPKTFSGIKSSLEFSSRFLKLSWSMMDADPSTIHFATSRVFSVLACFVRCLHTKPSILLFIETISCPLLQWLSHREIHEESTNEQLYHLWAEILDCLRRCQPPIVFDSSLLKLQAPLLEKTLDHPKSTISELTVTFWNSTYGKQIKLDYPKSLLDILDKLSRNKRINLRPKSLQFLVKCHPVSEVTARRSRVTATNSRNSKRVELVEDAANRFEPEKRVGSSSKRKSLGLTEHQKEVRRAQQGRGMDCSGHGPGIRTYTSVDFSQGNEDSQESQEIRDPESILEMLRRIA
uniref:Telomere-associated protein Rif1 N-terminal domain-containing protein n=1 Tax=Salix viminalis TaxID=40686 RepID=A0A6N2N0Q9_SALVM